MFNFWQIKFKVVFIIHCFIIIPLFAEDVDIRKPGDCGTRRIEVNTSGPSAEKEPVLSQTQKKEKAKLIEEEKKKIPTKIIIERPRIISRIRYLKEWKENPNAIRNLLIYLEQILGIFSFQITSHENIELSDKQKKSVLHQLQDFEISLEDTDDNYISAPVLSGNIESDYDDNQIISAFEVIENNQKETADSFLILHMTGQNYFKLNQKQIKSLKSYILRGGFILADCASGNQEFGKGFINLMKQMFPDKEFKTLSSDHPVFSTVFDLKKIRYTGKIKEADSLPRIKGLSIDCRTAVFYSQDTLSCGWDGHVHGEYIDYEIHYEDALKLGANIISYALGYRELGSKLFEPVLIKEKKIYDGTSLALARIKYKGDCNTDFFGATQLLEYLHNNLNAKVRSSVTYLGLTDASLYLYPFVYLSGHGEIVFSDDEMASLKNYLERGGVLFADACCGDTVFDDSFRKVLKQILPDNDLRWLRPNHKIFSSFYSINEVQYKSRGKQLLSKLLHNLTNEKSANMFIQKNIPYLEGLYLNDKLSVIYSPVDIGCAWEKQPCLMCAGISHQNNDAFKLALNIIYYIYNL